MSNKWRTRHELPVIAKLKLNIDIDRLKQEVSDYVNGKYWNSFGNEYYDLCKSYEVMPEKFFKKPGEEERDICDLDWNNSPYRQIGLTGFDDEFSLEKRNKKSGTIWDSRISRKNPILDERWYRKLKTDVPPYLKEVLNLFNDSHRTRFSELAPMSSVKPHIDHDTTYSIRLHIAITTNEKCLNGGWTKDNEKISAHIPDDGSVWFVNSGVMHYAENLGSTPRNHLIIGVDSQDMLEKYL
jgi:hypothetical protein